MPIQSSTELERLSFSYAGAFSSLLPLGVVTLSSFHGLPGPGPLAPDGWSWASPLPWISSRRGTREADLEFLTNNDFIRATYRLEGPGRARVRIYVLPEDCEWYLVREPRTEFRGRALLKTLWDSVLDASSEAWHFFQPGHDQFRRFPAVMEDDDVSLNLSEIFNTLPSPKPDLELSQSASLLTRTILESVLEDDGVPGFKSQLYNYQRESVWRMLQKELLPQKRPDPRLRKWSGPTGVVAWINLDDMTFWRKQQHVDDIPGGILCEEMGTGKTCICLALILLTVHQRANPPPGHCIILPKSTSLYQRCFNTVIQHGIPFKHLEPRPHFFPALESAQPFYQIKPPSPKRARRTHSLPEPPAANIYLSTGTLVVVPDTLIQQWSMELLKHVQEDILSVLIISKPTQPIPPHTDLLKYDIVLFSHSRFGKEDDDGRFGNSRSYPCQQCIACHEECHCFENSQSPLLRVRWKRLIIDEGHVLGQGTTRLVSLAGRLHVDRRWCVTGTISNHMMGMDLGMERRPSETGLLTPPSSDEELIASRKPEQLDLKRLGTICIDFLHLPPFVNPDIWTRYVARPYTENLRGSMSSLKSIMTLMIRHRPQDIERDVILPRLHTKTVLLTPTRENRLSINVLTSLIALNAVLTQRCDQDYFFHVSQLKARDEVVRNLMLAAFHFTGPAMNTVMEAIVRGERALDKWEEKGYSQEDLALLKRGIGCLKEAVGDVAWRTMVVREQPGSKDVTSQEMGYFLKGCPKDVGEAWKSDPVPKPLSDYSPATTHDPLFSGPGLLAMQQHLPILARTPSAEQISLLSSQGHAHRTQRRQQLEESLDRSRKRQPSTNHTPTKRSEEEQKFRKVVQHECDHYNLQQPREPPGKKRPAQFLSSPLSPGGGLKSILKNGTARKDLEEGSELARVEILRTASAKLNYLLTRIVEVCREEKIIVFSDYAPMMWYLGEALEILGIEHLIYIQRLTPVRRSQYIVTFNSSPHYRVMIMETKVAAHGLNVTSASRVFFMNACWQRSVERQAIKRAHRIGQTREVYVETLVVKDTIEEELLKRREEMGREQLDRTKRFTDDGKLRSIISSAKFVPETPPEEECVGLGRLFKRKGREADEIDRELNIVDDDDKIVKKRKVVTLHETAAPAVKEKRILKSTFAKGTSDGISMDIERPKAKTDGVRRRVQFVIDTLTQGFWNSSRYQET